MWKILYIICVILQFLPNLAFVTFTNLKCINSDKNFCEFSKCNIKAVNRTHKYLELHAVIHQVPVNNITIRLKTMHFNNGYKPFFIDVTFDACNFLKNPKNIFVKAFYDVFKKTSNMNHTCPYNHDLIVDKLYTGNLETDLLGIIPAASGRYAVYMDFSVLDTPRASVNTYFTLS
ncbi:uncharacterized protein Dwil_GK28067 [Drosophila willistoni]|uniref:MD-2-related lipid-recognition domain-containing protein n=1 Tax=Drosophila willistoni TaxID=7260 RepID=A0A0Q9X357_DROWI|nr:uncharacterized protein LOC26530069 [Drosophila willistoni]KRF99248.1 uncharacterized protein Dwil_GK28067 [Drosophila willistoni]